MRRYSDIPLPAAPYRPGSGAVHPKRRPPGSHLPDLSDAPLTDRDWSRTPRWLYAADLFNRGYWWEVHEVLEELWLPLDRESETARRLQAVILAAAALLKSGAGEARAAAALAAKARRKLGDDRTPRFGLDVAALVDAVAAHLADPGAEPPRLRLGDGDPV